MMTNYKNMKKDELINAINGKDAEITYLKARIDVLEKALYTIHEIEKLNILKLNEVYHMDTIHQALVNAKAAIEANANKAEDVKEEEPQEKPMNKMVQRAIQKDENWKPEKEGTAIPKNTKKATEKKVAKKAPKNEGPKTYEDVIALIDGDQDLFRKVVEMNKTVKVDFYNNAKKTGKYIRRDQYRDKLWVEGYTRVMKGGN